MDLSTLFPPEVREIPLLYLTLPELLAREKNEEEVALLLTSKEFWYHRLEEYELGVPEYPRIRYYIAYALREYMRGYTFELGQLRSPVFDDFYSRMIKTKQLRTQFEIGRHVSEYNTLGISVYEDIRYYAALHYGDKAEICRLLSVSEEKSLAGCEHPPCVPCSKESIQHAIAWGLHTPIDVVRQLVINGQEKGFELIQYVLEEYPLSIAALRSILNTSIEIIKRNGKKKEATQNEAHRFIYAYSIDCSSRIHNAVAKYIIDAST